MSELLKAALSYAGKGWPVLPLHSASQGLCSCGKRDCTSAGKHPRTKNGLKDASADAKQIQQWWKRWPDANIAIVTGAVSGLLVLDVDGDAGSESLNALLREHGPLLTMTVNTGKGKHYYFRHPGIPVKNSVQKLGVGLDIRADGGYIVAPPSMHASGKQYQILEDSREPAELPPWLLDAISSDPKENALPSAENVFEGERNNTLYRLACALRGQHGMEEGQIEAVLLEYNTAKCVPPLDEAEVLNIAASACKHPAEIRHKRQDENPLYWYKLNTRHWFSSQTINSMTDYQTGWYVRLYNFAWDSGGFLPNDRKVLATLARAKSRKAFERDCDLVLSEFELVEVNGQSKLRHPGIVAEYTRALEKWNQKREAGEARMLQRTVCALNSVDNSAPVIGKQDGLVN